MRNKNSFINSFFKSTGGETLLLGKNFSKSSTSSSSRVVRNEIFLNSNKMNNSNNGKCFTTTTFNNATTTKNASESFLSPGSFSLGAMKRLLFSSGRDSSFSWNALKKRGGTKHRLITAGARAIYANGRSTRENMDSNRARLSGVGRRVS